MIRVYRALLRAQLQLAAQYRAQMFLYLFFSFMRPVIFLAAWIAVAQSQGGAVGGYAVADFAAYYVALTIVVHFTIAWNDHEFSQEVRLGRLSAKLLRPLHPIHYAIAENIVWKLFTALGLVPVLALIAVTFGARFQTEPIHLLLFVVSLALGAALSFVTGWIVATAAFWTTRTEALSELNDRMQFVFAGQIAPLALMPGPLQWLVYLLPYGYMRGVPAEILQGAVTPGQALLLVVGQAAWLGIAYLLLQLVWRLGVRQYGAVGA